MMKTWIAIAVVALSGCDLYFSGGDDAPCMGGVGAEPPVEQYRDPVAGTCIGVGGWGNCDDECGNCAYDIAQPDYGLCYSGCTGLDEGTCQATSGCYAAYEEPAAGDTSRPAFSGCWQTPPSGPVQGSCQGLDAQSCSRHDNCAMLYDTFAGQEPNTGYSTFVECIDEPATGSNYCVDDAACGSGAHCDTTICYPDPNCTGCPTCGACADVCYGVCVSDAPTCASTDCGPGYHCEDQCYPTDGTNGPPEMSWCTATCIPDESSCNLIDCGPGYECIDSCDMTPNNTMWCSAQCVPTGGGDPGDCTGAITCDIAGPPPCPFGTTPGIKDGCYTGYCIPNNECGPNDPGDCYGQVACAQPSPACPAGTTAGIANGCYTGYCIPEAQCTAAPCETLTTESACSGRMDCSPVYTGTNCTCDANGCTCQTLSFARCEAWWF